MSLFEIVIVLALAGFFCWLVLRIPQVAPFKELIIGVVAAFVVFWLLQEFGVHTGLPHLRLFR